MTRTHDSDIISLPSDTKIGGMGSENFCFVMNAGFPRRAEAVRLVLNGNFDGPIISVEDMQMSFELYVPILDGFPHRPISERTGSVTAKLPSER